MNNHIANISDKIIDELCNQVIDYFDKSPFFELSNIPPFQGAGIYALYIKPSSKTLYKDVLPAMYPIYIGKAVPAGSRQGVKSGVTKGSPLRARLTKHLSSIEQANNLDASDFLCRFIVLEGKSSDFISAFESIFIKKYNTLWNSHIDGFGINAPGSGRYNQSPSEWDTLHPGRYYASQLTGSPRDLRQIMQKIVNYKPK
ncbi:Eco29kI family restriction endonuclease [Shewanella baltica]|uniref:Eco29kI family restriction endonuclease n=1 Tax=Shewanella baltica TaxID=62322 RepID=UPI003D7AD0E6